MRQAAQFLIGLRLSRRDLQMLRGAPLVVTIFQFQPNVISSYLTHVVAQTVWACGALVVIGIANGESPCARSMIRLLAAAAAVSDARLTCDNHSMSRYLCSSAVACTWSMTQDS